MTIARIVSSFDLEPYDAVQEGLELYRIRIVGYARKGLGEVKVRVTKKDLNCRGNLSGRVSLWVRKAKVSGLWTRPVHHRSQSSYVGNYHCKVMKLQRNRGKKASRASDRNCRTARVTGWR
jgi:hypothetical protein